MGEVERSAAHMGEVVESTLRHGMLTRDMTRIQQIIDDVGGQRGIESIFLLNHEGEVRFAAGRRGVGTRPAISGPGCRECHGQGKPPLRASAILTTPEGKRVLRTCNAVRNEAACQRCHNPQQNINGVLITDISIATVDRYLAHLILVNVGLFVGVLVAAALTVNLAMNRLVVGRLETFARTIHAFGRGDLGQRVRISGSDEVQELAGVFNRMADGLEEKGRLEEKDRQRTQELQQLYEALREKEVVRERLLSQVIKAQEEERMRLARELHDELAQALTALSMRLESVERASGPHGTPLRQQVEQTRELTLRLLGETRRLILALRPTMLDDLGLVSAIRWYAETHLTPLGVELDLATAGLKQRLPPETETTIFRIAQEAMNNIARHAQATRVSIRLELIEGRVTATIQDDGRGFDLAEVEVRDPAQRMGLLGMRERAGLVGGNLRIVSRPGAGTRVELEVPASLKGVSNGKENPRGDR